MIVIVVQALVRLARSALRGPLVAMVGCGVLGGFLVGVDEVLLLAVGGSPWSRRAPQAKD